jgi:protein TonB
MVAFVPAPPWRPVGSPGHDSRPFTVRIEPVPATVPLVPAEKSVAGPGTVRRKRDTVREAGVPAIDRQTLPLPARTDATVYAASDLDTLPRPVAPLEIGPMLERSGGSALPAIRLELVIDEHGTVRNISFAGAGAAGAVEREVRDAIAAMLFIPAQKNGIPVKSRVTLSVGLAAGRAGE